jgi:chromosome segregation protein
VLRELRRQLRPLERQAEAADRHAALQAELREVKVRIAALELDRLTRLVEAEDRDDSSTGSAGRRRGAATCPAAGATLEAELGNSDPRSTAPRRTVYGLTSLAERLRGTSDLIEAKRRHLVEYVEEPLAGRPPEELRAQADRIASERTERAEDLRPPTVKALEEPRAERREASSPPRPRTEAAGGAASPRGAARARAALGGGGVRLARSDRVRRGRARPGHLDPVDARQPHRRSRARRRTVQDEIHRLDTSEVELTSRWRPPRPRSRTHRSRPTTRRPGPGPRGRALVAGSRGPRRCAPRSRRPTGAAPRCSGRVDGVLGPVADHVRVAGGHDGRWPRRSGRSARPSWSRPPERARRAVAWLREVEAGHGHRPGGAPGPARERPDRRDAGTAGRPPARDRSPSCWSRQATARLNAGSHGVASGAGPDLRRGDWDTAVLLHGREADLTFVTADGDLAGPHGFRAGGTANGPVLTATAADQAEARAAELTRPNSNGRRRAQATRSWRSKEALGRRRDRAHQRVGRADHRGRRAARPSQQGAALPHDPARGRRGPEVRARRVLERDRGALSELQRSGSRDRVRRHRGRLRRRGCGARRPHRGWRANASSTHASPWNAPPSRSATSSCRRRRCAAKPTRSRQRWPRPRGARRPAARHRAVRRAGDRRSLRARRAPAHDRGGRGTSATTCRSVTPSEARAARSGPRPPGRPRPRAR